MFNSEFISLTKYAVVFSLILLLAACGGGGGGGAGTVAGDGDGNTNVTTPQELSLNQAVWNGVVYRYGHNAPPNIYITGAPDDTDWHRWAMLHDGATYRLYFFRRNTNDTLYQFGYNPNSGDYEYGYNSIRVLRITGTPFDADTSSFAMLHDGSDYRLYMRSFSNPSRIYQFAFNRATTHYQYGYRSIPVMDVTGAPADVDWERWGMLYDGGHYRHYAFKKGSKNQFYQFAFNRSTQDYEYGYNSIRVLSVVDMPENSNTSDFAMLHNGSSYRFYFQTH